MTSHLVLCSAGVKEAKASSSISVYGCLRQGQPFEFSRACGHDALAMRGIYPCVTNLLSKAGPGNDEGETDREARHGVKTIWMMFEMTQKLDHEP